ncbi:phosphoadenosine phosphosulfate reductase [Skermanella stibiiresistens SB22]|uniref:Adenosine 5'-phosphosulfate reductase n=1 Tax=Skermanella stibiiresistens SB22 TaxID=1385369 RepID=W9H941_9PROT|nr:phosphoadenylyl-sulfate reductase [Skermanella stibiiresistens]EWY42569.1 phosphoadenosine phosphosulfate reductase [Skermanella stibiiresistens SB22]
MDGLATSHIVNDLDALRERYAGLSGADLLRPLMTTEFRGRVALVSSFGTEAAVLLALAAEVDPGIPVIFLDTGKLFGETLRYRDTLIKRLGLTDVRTIEPDAVELKAADPEGLLWQTQPDACCHVRKTVPLNRALAGFDAWITGRKRFQATTRAALADIELDVDGRHKINPLASWTPEMIKAEFERRDLPRHPLEADGFLSIGCMPCTDRVAPGEDARSGRWAGLGKTECGIHLSAVPRQVSIA